MVYVIEYNRINGHVISTTAVNGGWLSRRVNKKV